MFVVMIAGAVLGYSTSMDKLEDALEKTMPQFVEDPNAESTNVTQKSITEAWNEVQTSVSGFINNTVLESKTRDPTRGSLPI